MLSLASIVLLYQAVTLLGFGLIGLALFPAQLLEKNGAAIRGSGGLLKGKTGPSGEELREVLFRDTLIYRICGLWVAAGGAVSVALALHGTDWARQWGCLLFTAVHGVEASFKAYDGQEFGKVAANGHLAVLNLAVWVFGF